jgi:cytoskeletal protein CcmA (bactofilin family)
MSPATRKSTTGFFEKLDVKGLLVLRATGRVDGNVSFGKLTIEQGAPITGEVSSTDYRTNQQSSYCAN